MMTNWSHVAVRAAAAASPGSRQSPERASAGIRAAAPHEQFSRAISSMHGASPRAGSNMRGRFDDNRSRKQISAYLAYRSRASDERNERALARWNTNLRQQWEIEHLRPSPRARGLAPRQASASP